MAGLLSVPALTTGVDCEFGFRHDKTSFAAAFVCRGTPFRITAFEISFDLFTAAPRVSTSSFRPVKLGQVFLNGVFTGTFWKILKFSVTSGGSTGDWSVSCPVNNHRLLTETVAKISDIKNLDDFYMSIEIVPVPEESRTSRFSDEYQLKCSFPAHPEVVKFELLCQAQT
jgi:hypothetical protein